MKKAKVSLQASEGLVFESAARIYSAYLAGGKVKDGEEQQWMERSVKEAVQLAHLVEQSVQSDHEFD